MPFQLTVLYLQPDDPAALAEGMGSPEGDAAARNLRTLATGGVTLLTGDVTT